MTQFVPLTTARQGSVTPPSVTDLQLDVEVLAERYEALSQLEAEAPKDGPTEDADDSEETPADDLPF